MQRITDEVWLGSYLTENDDLDTLNQKREWVRSWGGELGTEAVKVFTTTINYYNFFVQFKDMTLAAYSFDSWTELEGTLYDNHITVSREAGYTGEIITAHLLKYDDLVVGYALRCGKGEVLAHINSRFDIRSKASPWENYHHGAQPALRRQLSGNG